MPSIHNCWNSSGASCFFLGMSRHPSFYVDPSKNLQYVDVRVRAKKLSRMFSFLADTLDSLRLRRRMRLSIVFFLLCGLAGAQQAQKPLDGKPWDFGVWAGGGLSVPGGTKDTHVMNLG